MLFLCVTLLAAIRRSAAHRVRGPWRGWSRNAVREKEWMFTAWPAFIGTVLSNPVGSNVSLCLMLAWSEVSIWHRIYVFSVSGKHVVQGQMQFHCKNGPAIILNGNRAPSKWIALCCSIEVLNCLMSISKLKPCHWWVTGHLRHESYPVSKAAGGLRGVPAAPSCSTALSPEVSELTAYCLYCLDLRITLHLSAQFWDGLWHSDTHPNVFLSKV